MKRIKLIIVSAVLILSISLLSGCIFQKVRSYEEISDYVMNHKEKLEELIKDNEGFEESDTFDYKKYLGSFTIVDSAYAYTTEIVDFGAGGSGLVTDSIYTGFYYSANDTPYGRQFDIYPQTTEDDGYVVYHNDDEVSFIKTKRICPNWFYYYMEWH